MQDQDKYQQCLEAICGSGCEAVRATIEAMEENQEVSQTSSLDEDQRRTILEDLKAIMAVYDDREC